MARICVGGILTPEGQSSWIIPALPNDEGGRQCIESGGSIQETGGSCATESTAQSSGPGIGAAAGEMVSASLVPIRRLRDAMAHTELIASLELLNRSEEVQRIFLEDAEMKHRFATLIAQASSTAASLFTSPGQSKPIALNYSRQLHDPLRQFAEDLAEQLSDSRLRESLNSIVAETGKLVGVPLAEIVEHYVQRQAGSAD